MCKYGFLLVVSLFACPSFGAQRSLLPFSNDHGVYGYCDESGETVVECQFKKATCFSDGFALVSKEGTSVNDDSIYYIDALGKKVLCQWETHGWTILAENMELGLFNVGLAWQCRFEHGTNTFFCIDTNGNVKSSFSIGYTPMETQRSAGFLTLGTKDGYVVFDSDARSRRFDDARDFVMHKDGRGRYHSRNGCYCLFDFYEEKRFVALRKGLLLHVYDDTTGILTCTSKQTVEKQCSMKRTIEYYDSSGNHLVGLQQKVREYDDWRGCWRGHILVRLRSKWGAVDIGGTVRIPPVYDAVQQLENYIVGWCNEGDMAHFYDGDGRFLCELLNVEAMSEQSGEWCCLSKEGYSSWFNPSTLTLLWYDASKGHMAKLKTSRSYDLSLSNGK